MGGGGAVQPPRLLAKVFGSDIYVHKPVEKWSRLTVAGFMGVEGRLETWQFKNGGYKAFGNVYRVKADRSNFPRALLKVASRCNSAHKLERMKKQ